METEPIKNGIAYMRSATMQDFEFRALEYQRNIIRGFCEENNINVLRAYTDMSSGKNMERTGLLDMMKSVHKKQPKEKTYLIITAWDRLSRDFGDTSRLKFFFKIAEIEIIVINEIKSNTGNTIIL